MHHASLCMFVCAQFAISWVYNGWTGLCQHNMCSSQWRQMHLISHVTEFVARLCVGVRGGGYGFPKNYWNAWNAGKIVVKSIYVLRLKWHLLNIPPRTTEAQVSLVNIMHTKILSVPSFWGYVEIKLKAFIFLSAISYYSIAYLNWF